MSEAVKEDRPAPPAPVVVASSIASLPPPPTIAMETTIAPAKPVEQIGIFVRGMKIASIGVRVRRWVALHGASLNVAPELEHFSGHRAV